MKSNLLKYTAVVGILAAIFFVNQAFGEKINFNAIKPAGKVALTDEQQAILSVRKAKASVVNIVGLKNVLTSGDKTLGLEPVGGTGIIYSSNGLILSNSHVVQDQSVEYSVIFADGQTYKAKVLGLDKYNDVALLKIEKDGLQAAVLGNSDELETGQTVFAIGNSLGKFQNTVTRGVVSGLSRGVNLSEENDTKPRMLNLIQTDAAINPGNSGGPLINLNGEVVGMNTLVETDAQGIGFAVPVNIIKDSIDQLQAFGKVSRPFFGVNFETITPAVKILRQLKEQEGAYIIDTAPNGPAEKAGIKAGDIIKEINHEALTQANELDIAVLKHKAGDQVLITLLRNGEKVELPMILAEFK